MGERDPAWLDAMDELPLGDVRVDIFTNATPFVAMRLIHKQTGMVVEGKSEGPRTRLQSFLHGRLTERILAVTAASEAREPDFYLMRSDVVSLRSTLKHVDGIGVVARRDPSAVSVPVYVGPATGESDE